MRKYGWELGLLKTIPNLSQDTLDVLGETISYEKAYNNIDIVPGAYLENDFLGFCINGDSIRKEWSTDPDIKLIEESETHQQILKLLELCKKDFIVMLKEEKLKTCDIKLIINFLSQNQYKEYIF